MKFLFSQREVARQAALAAVERYPRDCLDKATGAVQEFWSFVVNALLDAIPEPRIELRHEVHLQDEPNGWLAWTRDESPHAGSLNMELDVTSWEDGKNQGRGDAASRAQAQR